MSRHLRLRPCACAAAVLLVAAVPAARAQCDSTAARPLDVAGQVIDARLLVPLRATVHLTVGRDTLATIDADSAGFFSTTLCRRAGIVAHFRRIGYRADSLVVPHDTTRWMPLDVAMSPLRESAVTLAGTRVTAPRTSVVEARVRRAGGVFISPEEIDRAKPSRASDLFRARRGVTLDDVDGALRVVSTRGLRPATTDGGTRQTPTIGTPNTNRDTTAINAGDPTSRVKGGGEACPLRIGVDGHVMPEDFRVDEIGAMDIMAVEIYPSAASMPVEFASSRRSTSCGLVMIWTRDGSRPL